MGEAAETFRAMKHESQRRRAHNRKYSAELLRVNGVKYEPKNVGAHLIVQGPNSIIDFWPRTGRWHDRAGIRGFGVQNLLKHIGCIK